MMPLHRPRQDRAATCFNSAAPLLVLPETATDPEPGTTISTFLLAMRLPLRLRTTTLAHVGITDRETDVAEVHPEVQLEAVPADLDPSLPMSVISCAESASPLLSN